MVNTECRTFSVGHLSRQFFRFGSDDKKFLPETVAERVVEFGKFLVL